MATDTIPLEQVSLLDDQIRAAAGASRWGVRRGFLIALCVAAAWPCLIVCLIPFDIWAGFAITRLRSKRRRAKLGAAFYVFDPEVAIRQCVRRRTKPPGGFLPGTAMYALQRAETLLESDVTKRARRSDQLSPAALLDVEPEHGFFALFDHLLTSRVDRGQLLVCAIGASAWVLVPLFLDRHPPLAESCIALAALTVAPLSLLGIRYFTLVEVYNRLDVGLRQWGLAQIRAQRTSQRDLSRAIVSLTEQHGLLLRQNRVLRREIRDLRELIISRDSRPRARSRRRWRFRWSRAG